MKNSLMQLMQKHQQGNRPAFHMGPFLPLTRIREKGLPFNAILRDPQPMTEAALMSFEFGFESTVLPFDLNVEAEILGAKVHYHEGFEGHPVYPTIADKPVKTVDDIKIPTALAEKGRLPAILDTIRCIKYRHSNKGAVGVFLPGPFTLAGQVMDMEKLFLMLLKQPASAQKIFERLTQLILELKEVYLGAGIDFLMVVEGAGASISPKAFRSLLLPCMQDIFRSRKVPQVVSLFGSSEQFVELMLECHPDGISLDKECDIETARKRIPGSIPLVSICGGYDMLANATPAEITEKVNRYLSMGCATVLLPADIYPPARVQNIEAFVKALREYAV